MGRFTEDAEVQEAAALVEEILSDLNTTELSVMA
jgi:hypothetical protein